jgi:CRISPR-associated protein Cas1
VAFRAKRAAHPHQLAGGVVTALGVGYATDPKRVTAQLDCLGSSHALKFAIALIQEKLRNSIDTLSIAFPISVSRDQAIMHLTKGVSELAKRAPKTIGDLLGLEGRAASAYFSAWRMLPLRWESLSRHPIPTDWQNFAQRYSFARKNGGTRNASHPLNAILNYAYAILESQVRVKVLAMGLDPTIGVLHSGRRGRADFVLDLMEPLRPLADR